jgi:predicted regulator of Ras-like GTPase activity (Roadblock/LC7/MglB family)
MSEGIDRYLTGDIEDEVPDEGHGPAPVIIPAVTEVVPTNPEPTSAPQPAAATSAPVAQPPASAPTAPSSATPLAGSREARLSVALEKLMRDSSDIEASALVSLDGFMIASALPAGMQEDRVGAMSAAILALGERAAAELGRGKLTQVFIEAEQGYVVLVSAGDRAVLTVLANRGAKLGLVLYDMRAAADTIAEVLS